MIPIHWLPTRWAMRLFLFSSVPWRFVELHCFYALQPALSTLWLLVLPDLLITAIIVVNDLRDIPTASKTGKRTLAVMLGPRRTRIEYLLLPAGAYSTMPAVYLAGNGSPLPLLAPTAALILVFSLLLSAGISLPSG